MGNLSIGRRLKRLKTYQAQRNALNAWVENWKDDQVNVINNLRLAVIRDDQREIMHIIGQLSGMTEKRFSALSNVVQLVSDPQRVLIDCKDELEPAFTPTPELSTEPELDRKSQTRTKNASKYEVAEIVKRYKQGTAIKDIADTAGISVGKIIKILVTEDVYSSDTYDTIKDLRMDGVDESEIAKICDLGKSAMDMYTPYRKGIYYADTPTKNAIKIRKSRERKSSIDKLYDN